jgi:2,3-bisphosphoglycerate-independent phosphoglycerate mutase
MNYKPVVLVILDGWGYRTEAAHNAIKAAQTPFFDSLYRDYPYAVLSASGESLGLPEGQIGSSEIGHTTLGLGQIMDNDLVRKLSPLGVGSLVSVPCLKNFLRM